MDELLLKAEKANAIPRNNNNNIFGAISKTLRILELCILLILLSWIITRLPFALSLSAQFLRRIAAFAATPLFVFALSNAIIAALLAQSARSAPHHSADGLYSEFLNSRNTAAPPPPELASSPQPAAAEFQDKQVISETVQDRASVGAGARSETTKYRRSQSEKWKGVAGKAPRRRQLRRSETEKRRENSPEILYPQDKLSNEEFQRAIEAFIAKQMRFLREESSAIVVQNP